MSTSLNLFEKLTNKAAATVTAAIHLAVENDHVETTPLHLALALFNDDSESEETTHLFKSAIKQAGGDPNLVQRELNKLFIRLIQQQPPPPSPSLSSKAAGVMMKADALRAKMHDGFIAQDHMLLALIQDDQVSSALKAANVNTEALRKAVEEMRKGKKIDSKTAEGDFENLKKYGVDLTALAEEGKLDPVVGRDNEIRRVIRILCRRTKNNPVLIGEPGVGKTAIAEGLALRIVNRDVPASLMGRLFSLDLGALIAGASHKGEHEERIKNVLDEVVKSAETGPGVILFIDEMHLLVDGGKMDAANLLKPLLARGKLRCIGATTLSEYSQHIESDGALERRFSQVLIKEPTVPETINILRGIREKYEVHHGVRILDPALIAAAELAHRYLTMRRLPDSAIDLVDECCASVRAQRETRPEAIDQLERTKMELNIEIHALEREKDERSKERLQAALKERESIDEKLRPLLAAYNLERKTGDEINAVRKKIDELKAKADDAERRYDISTASDIRYYAIPELQKKVKDLEEKKRQEDASDKQLVPDSVTADAIAEVVARWTGIPTSRLKSTEKQKLLKMEKVLSKQVVGQPEAVSSVANAIRLSRSGLANAARPIASFLFAGPSGTGKTLLAKTLATLLFDSPDAMIRIDASEYSEKHSISRLIGSPPGYVGYDQGGQLTDYVRRKPYCILLIDEIEKAAKEFITLFLQVLDDGRLTDSHGRVVDFRNTVIIMTSNLGAAYLNELPEVPGPIPAVTKELVMGAIRKHFVPEFINRIDDITIFRTLSRDSMSEIVDLRLKEIEHRLHNKKVTLDVDQSARHYLASAGYSPTYGARPLHRVIQQELLNPLSVMLLDERVRHGETCKVRFDGPHNRIYLIPNHEKNKDDEMDDVIIEEVESDLDEEDKWLIDGAKREGERMM